MSKLNKKEIYYPESDGKPMADSTLQYEWMVTIKENLDYYLSDFVASDLLWYPVKGDRYTSAAPDVMVALGRPKGHRGSYKQWEENNIAPQIVFEILSHTNTKKEMKEKLEFYERYKVQEYYVYDPQHETLEGYIYQGDKLLPIAQVFGWTSPLLKIRFERSNGTLVIISPNGKEFISWQNLAAKADKETQKTREVIEKAKEATEKAEQMIKEAEQRAEEEHKRAEEERKRAEEEHKRAEEERKRAEEERKRAEEESRRAEEESRRAEQLLAKLRALGIDPDSL